MPTPKTDTERALDRFMLRAPETRFYAPDGTPQSDDMVRDRTPDIPDSDVADFLSGAFETDVPEPSDTDA
jgi:hypothetical protein